MFPVASFILKVYGFSEQNSGLLLSAANKGKHVATDGARSFLQISGGNLLAEENQEVFDVLFIGKKEISSEIVSLPVLSRRNVGGGIVERERENKRDRKGERG